MSWKNILKNTLDEETREALVEDYHKVMQQHYKSSDRDWMKLNVGQQVSINSQNIVQVLQDHRTKLEQMLTGELPSEKKRNYELAIEEIKRLQGQSEDDFSGFHTSGRAKQPQQPMTQQEKEQMIAEYGPLAFGPK